jgi:hypothetical protein
MLLNSIAAVAGEPLTLDPADPLPEARASTWWLSADPGEKAALSAGQVCAAFERAAEALRSRIRGLGFQGAVTFYVWHDEQAGQLRCSTSSQAPGALPFNGTYVATDALGPIIERFLADQEPGHIPWSELNAETNQPASEPVTPPFPVWTRSVGQSP